MKCLKGHKLSSLYYFQSEPTRTMKTVKGYAYCKVCDKVLVLTEVD